MASTTSIERESGVIDSIVAEHGAGLVAFARSRGATDPEGLANEVFLRFFRQRDRVSFDQDAAIGSYLDRSAANLLTDEHRRRRARPIEVDQPLPERGADESPFEQQIDDSAYLEQLLAQLVDDQRAVVELRFLHDLSIEETAARLDKPIGTVKALQHHGIKRLRLLALAALIVLAVVGMVVQGRDWLAQPVQPVSSVDHDRPETPVGPNRTESVRDPQDRSGSSAGDAVATPTSIGRETLPPPTAGERSSPTPSPPVTAGPQTASTSVATDGAGAVGTTAPPSPSPSFSEPPLPSTTVPVPPPVEPRPEPAAVLVGPVRITSASTGDLLWVRESDNSLRADGTASSPANCFTIVRIDPDTIALRAVVGAREALVGIQNDSDNTLRARGGDGERPWLAAYRNDDGSYRLASVTFPGRLLRVDGSTVDSGGTLATDPATRFDISPISRCA